MGCGSCSSGSCGSGSKPAGCNSNGNCQTGSCGKLDVFDWLSGMERPAVNTERIVEVRFKNTRKEFYRFNSDIDPIIGDNVIVDSSQGYDLGSVSLTGELVPVQMRKKGVGSRSNLGKIRRLATQEDLDKWQELKTREQGCMVKARVMAKDLKLEMKISDVEYQADGTKATFFYTSEGRVDFRELIKKFAGTFKVRVEMKQIGTRQEAGRVGGIGSCGRELCCSSWLTDFRSVSTSAARYQQLAINPIKLAGQCGKLKCCLNYELDSYMDALSDFPKGDIKLHTKKGLAFLQKTDIFKKMLWFTYADEPAVFHPVPLDRVKEIIEMNQFKKKPDDLADYTAEVVAPEKEPDFENVVGQDDLTRFDRDNRRNRNKKRRSSNNKKASGNNNQNKQSNQNNRNKKQGGNSNKNNAQQAKKASGSNKPNNKKGGNSGQNKQQGNTQNRKKPNNNAAKKGGNSGGNRSNNSGNNKANANRKPKAQNKTQSNDKK